MKKFLFLLCLLAFQVGISQNFIDTEIKAVDVIQIFKNKQQVQWKIPNQKDDLHLDWVQRKSSFAEKEGIQTFVGYQKGVLTATIAFTNNKFSGNFNWNGESWKI